MVVAKTTALLTGCVDLSLAMWAHPHPGLLLLGLVSDLPVHVPTLTPRLSANKPILDLRGQGSWSCQGPCVAQWGLNLFQQSTANLLHQAPLRAFQLPQNKSPAWFHLASAKHACGLRSLSSWGGPGQHHGDVIYTGDSLVKGSVLVTLGHLWEARGDVHGAALAAHSTDLPLEVTPGFTSLSAS